MDLCLCIFSHIDDISMLTSVMRKICFISFYARFNCLIYYYCVVNDVNELQVNGLLISGNLEHNSKSK